MKNIEIKSKIEKPQLIREFLNSQGAEYKGKDHQVDTYFKVPEGRLKLREGEIESYLIYYKRPNSKEPKQSDLILYNPENTKKENLKKLLSESLGIWKIIDKKREIYFIENVKFHIDEVEDLGNFFEIEEIDREGNLEREKLLEKCNYFMNKLEIKNEDLVSESYSDML